LDQNDGGHFGTGTGGSWREDVDVVGVQAEGLEAARDGEGIFLDLAVGEGSAWKIVSDRVLVQKL